MISFKQTPVRKFGKRLHAATGESKFTPLDIEERKQNLTFSKILCLQNRYTI